MSQIKHVLYCIVNIKESGSDWKTLPPTNHRLFGRRLVCLNSNHECLLKIRSGLVRLIPSKFSVLPAIMSFRSLTSHLPANQTPIEQDLLYELDCRLWNCVWIIWKNKEAIKNIHLTGISTSCHYTKFPHLNSVALGSIYKLINLYWEAPDRGNDGE